MISGHGTENLFSMGTEILRLAKLVHVTNVCKVLCLIRNQLTDLQLRSNVFRTDWVERFNLILCNTYSQNEWMNEWIIYLMSKTWEVFAQPSEPEAN